MYDVQFTNKADVPGTMSCFKIHVAVVGPREVVGLAIALCTRGTVIRNAAGTGATPKYKVRITQNRHGELSNRYY